MKKIEDIILVTDVHTMGHLGVVRALGMSPYSIIAMSDRSEALGLRSSFPNKKVISPSYNDENYCNWILEWLSKNPVKAIIPSEGFLWATRPIFDEISHLIPIQNEQSFIYKYINKCDYFEKLLSSTNEEVSAHIPKSLIINQNTPPSITDIKKLSLPAFIKIDSTYSSIYDSDQVIKINSHEELIKKISQLCTTTSFFSVQGYVPGTKASVNLIHANGKILCYDMLLAEHESPYKGGLASLRRSWQHEAMIKDAKVKARCLGWNGVMMVEYRYDEQSDSFHLIEFNLRFWGALHLSLYHGVNFPLILVDHFLHKKFTPALHTNLNAISRNLTYETGHVLSYIKSTDNSFMKKLVKVFSFIIDGLNPNISSDTFYPGDRKVWLYEVYFLIKNLLR